MSACLETHIESLYRMGKGTYRNKVYTTLGIVTECIERDTTGRFGLIFSADHLDSFLCIFGSEVIEHDAVYPTDIQHLLKFVEIAHFDFNLEVFSFLDRKSVV